VGSDTRSGALRAGPYCWPDRWSSADLPWKYGPFGRNRSATAGRATTFGRLVQPRGRGRWSADPRGVGRIPQNRLRDRFL